MQTFKSFEQVLYTVNDSSFEDIALKLFNKQARENKVYSDFLKYLKINPDTIDRLEKIPFLPIGFFRNHRVTTGEWLPEIEFTSSGTTGSSTSHHLVPRLSFYLENAKRNFEFFFGPLSNYHILALLPSYLEREGSSLISMIDFFIRESGSVHGGFYLHNYDELIKKISDLKDAPGTVLLFGVSFALLDLAEQYELDLSHCMVVETGGMKGRRKEITREELHSFLGRKFRLETILSEYGMTELMSQAYSQGNGFYRSPPWMKVLIRETNDPFKLESTGKTGGVNIIDLANLYSCAFIETQDLGRVAQNGSFEILGRFDNTDIRGCNLLV